MRTALLLALALATACVRDVDRSEDAYLAQSYAMRRIAVDDQYVYYLDSCHCGAHIVTIESVRRSGGGGASIVSSTGAEGTDLAVDRERIWYGLETGLWSVPKGGGTPEQWATDPPTRIAVDDGFVYTTSMSQVRVYDKHAKDTVRFVNAYAPIGLAVAGGTVYFGTHDGTLMALDAGASDARMVAGGGGGIVDVRVDGDHIYFTNDTTVFRVPTTGGPLETVASDRVLPVSPVVRGNTLLFGTLYGIERAPLGGGEATLVRDLGTADTVVDGGDSLFWVGHAHSNTLLVRSAL